MPTMSYNVAACRVTDFDEEELRAVGELLASVWPRPDRGPKERAEQLREVGAGYSGPAELAPMSAVIRDGDRVIAHALTFARTVGTEAGGLTVLALSKVATDPTYRGQGLGGAVVTAAFQRVDAGVLPFALFQTSNEVRPFYERIGAELVENRIVNSLSADDPDANPFWDDVVLRYPGEGEWPSGVIDLRGAGY